MSRASAEQNALHTLLASARDIKPVKPIIPVEVAILEGSASRDRQKLHFLGSRTVGFNGHEGTKKVALFGEHRPVKPSERHDEIQPHDWGVLLRRVMPEAIDEVRQAREISESMSWGSTPEEAIALQATALAVELLHASDEPMALQSTGFVEVFFRER